MNVCEKERERENWWRERRRIFVKVVCGVTRSQKKKKMKKKKRKIR